MRTHPDVLDAINTSGLTKRYGKKTAVDSLDWVVPVGGITGLLGPNGAGKTTTLRMLFGLARPSAGSASVLGSDVRKQSTVVLSEAAFLPAEKEAPRWMGAGMLARRYGEFFPDWDMAMVDRLARRWEIPLDVKVRALSRGMRAKLLIAMALARHPQLLVLDEPTDGLDPAGIEDILTLLVDIAGAEGTAVVLSTHRLEEVERVCDRVTILSKGKLAVDGDADSLRSEWRTITARAALSAADLHAITSKGATHSSWREDDLVHIVANRGADAIAAALGAAGAQAVQARQMDIREIYLTVTNYPETTGDASAPSLRDRLA